MARLLRDRFFWAAVSLFIMVVLPSYLLEAYFASEVFGGHEYQSVFMLFRGVLLLIVVAIAAWGFGVRGGLVVWLAAGLSLLLYSLLVEAHPGSQIELLAQAGVLGVVGFAFSWLIGGYRRSIEEMRRSGEFFKTIFNSTKDAVAIIDVRDFSIVSANDSFLRQHALTAEQVIGKTCYQVTHHRSEPCVAPDDICPLRDTVITGKDSAAEHVHYTRDSEKRYMDVSTSPIKDEKGNIIQVLHIARDITRLKQEEEALRQRTRELSGLMAIDHAVAQNLPLKEVLGIGVRAIMTAMRVDGAAVLFVKDEDALELGEYQGLSAEFAAQIQRIKLGEGLSGQAALQRRPIAMDISQYPTERLAPLLIKEGFQTLASAPMLIGDKLTGVITVNRRRFEPFTETELRLLTTLATQLDVSYQHKQAEKELVRLRKAVEDSGEVIFLTDCDGIITYINPEFTRLYGYTPDETVGKTTPRILKSGRMTTQDYEWFWKTLLNKQVVKGELVNKTKDGRLVTIEGSASPILDEPGNIIGFLAIQRDITEHKRAEEVLRESEEKLRQMFISVTDGIVITDISGVITEINEGALALYGVDSRDKLLGENGFALIAQYDRERAMQSLQKTLERGSSGIEEYDLIRTDGSVFSVELNVSVLKDASANPVGLVAVIRDITERKRVAQALAAQKEQLYHIDRLASIGELASGVAHELNNPLTGVLGYSELVLAADIPQEVKADVAVIHSNAQRAATIVRGLLSFARRQTPAKKKVDITDVIENVLKMRSYELRVNNIEVVTEFARGLPGVMADSQQMEQVFLNIILNAEQAMLEAHGRGTLTVRDEVAGDRIKISFIDDGTGIPEENLSRVFDPFFTTREPGKGTGLGLSICHGIVTEHDGRIYAESKLGEGATFFVELPVAEEEGVSRENS